MMGHYKNTGHNGTCPASVPVRPGRDITGQGSLDLSRVVPAHPGTVGKRKTPALLPEPLLRPQPDGVSRYVTPAEAADAFPMREQSLRDIERRRAMVEGLSAKEAALVLYRAGECGDAVLECLGVEVPR